MSGTFIHILAFFQAASFPAIAPLLIGWIKKIKCWLQHRTAPSIFQPYHVLYKLLLKQPVMSHNVSWLFRFAPYAYFSLITGLCFCLPFFITATFAANIIDMIVFIGLLAFARITLVLAAMDTGTAFGSLGARREMFTASLAEPVLFIIFYNMALLSHGSYINTSAIYFLHHHAVFPGLVFSFLALVLITMVETGRVPIDNPETHLELTMMHQAMTLEYSGRYLALIEWGNAIKFIIFLSLITDLFMPWGLSDTTIFWQLLPGILTTLGKLFLLAVFMGILESINSKLRLFKIPDYLSGAFMLAILGVLITQLPGAGT